MLADDDMMVCDDDPDDVAMVCDEDAGVQIPIASFKSNHISQKANISAEDLSPTSLGV